MTITALEADIAAAITRHLPQLAPEPPDPLIEALAGLTPEERDLLTALAGKLTRRHEAATRDALAENARDHPAAPEPGDGETGAQPVPVAEQKAAGVPAADTVTMADQLAGTPAPVPPDLAVSDPQPADAIGHTAS